MSHYDKSDWLKYKSKIISNERADSMTEHLYNCNECLETFLSLTEHSELKYAEDHISKDFSAMTMNKIKNIDVVLRYKKYKNKKINKLIYYVAAAILTIAFMVGGYFNALVDSSKNLNVNVSYKIEDKLSNINQSLQENVVNKTSILIKNFENRR